MSNLKNELMQICKINPNVVINNASFEAMCKAEALAGWGFVVVQCDKAYIEAMKKHLQPTGLTYRVVTLFGTTCVCVAWGDPPLLYVHGFVKYTLQYDGTFVHRQKQTEVKTTDQFLQGFEVGIKSINLECPYSRATCKQAVEQWELGRSAGTATRARLLALPRYNMRIYEDTDFLYIEGERTEDGDWVKYEDLFFV